VASFYDFVFDFGIVPTVSYSNLNSPINRLIPAPHFNIHGLFFEKLLPFAKKNNQSIK
jgi:hypothetical protein